MRFLLLSSMITAVLFCSVSAHAQSAPAPEPVTLPDLSPDILVKPEVTYQPPPGLVEETRSIIAPSQEPGKATGPRRWRGKTADDIFITLPYEIQNMILEETYRVNAQCHQYGTYAQFHDCECLGSRYFEERIFSPEDNSDAIVGRISGECASTAGVAGYGYDQCVSGMQYLLAPERGDDYCTCFGNQLAENYKNNPNPDYDNLRALSSQTNTFCLQKVSGAVKEIQ